MDVSPRGYRSFNVVYSDGDIAFHMYPANWVGPDTLRQLRERLDAEDPISLRLIKPAPHRSRRPA